MSEDLSGIIRQVYANVHLEEGISYIHSFLFNAYMNDGISVKQMSRLLLLPVPVVSAVKNELKKQSVLQIKSGISLSPLGQRFVREFMGYENVDTEILNGIINSPGLPVEEFANEIDSLDEIFQQRPSVDVTVDQSLCTAETAIKRAVLLLKSGALIGKKVVCIGDDDLISIAVLLVLKHVGRADDRINDMVELTVFDIDERVLRYIEEVSGGMKCKVNCIQHDMRKQIDSGYARKYDCVITDPPYTAEGLELFLSRGALLLKDESDLFLFLSFAHKSPLMRLQMQKLMYESGYIITEILNRFNSYNGAQILGGVSDAFVLKTSTQTKELITGEYNGPIYTNELNRNVRIYQCKSCQARYNVGYKQRFATIEQLKGVGCEECGMDTFALENKSKVPDEVSG